LQLERLALLWALLAQLSPEVMLVKVLLWVASVVP
jgi:hypothetical protein